MIKYLSRSLTHVTPIQKEVTSLLKVDSRENHTQSSCPKKICNFPKIPNLPNTDTRNALSVFPWRTKQDFNREMLP